MLKRKQFILISLCVLIALGIFQLSGCGSSAIHADYPFYADDQSLFNRADLIITGVVVKINKPEKIDIRGNKTGQSTDDDKTLFTVSEIKVMDVIKGDVKTGDIVKVKQLGDKNGFAEDALLQYDGYFKKNNQYVLFLKGYSFIDPEIPYSTLSPIQGQINIEDGKTKVNEINPLYKSGIPKDEFVAGLKSRMASMNQ